MNGPKSSGQEVTLAYPKRNSRKERTLLVEINSRDRNRIQYPNSTEFRWRFFRPLKDVVHIQIAGGTIPFCTYNINCGWNSFTFQEGTKRFNATLTPGKYNFSQLATEVAYRMNIATGVSNTYVVEFSSITGKMTILRSKGKEDFGLLFATGDFVDFYDQNNTLQKINSPAHLFGFEKKDYFNGANEFIVSPNVADLDFILTRIYVYLNHDNNQDISTVERSVGRQQPHAIVYMDPMGNNYKYLNKETHEPLFEAFPAPIARMATLDVSLRDEFDRLIDLNGRDFTLLLEIVYLD